MEKRTSSPEGPQARYQRWLAEGAVKPDSAQAAAAEKLQALHEALQGYRPSSSNGKSLLARLGFASRKSSGEVPLGLYLFGPVGRGKSMLMDLFHETAPVRLKRRVHFHAFMQEVHDELHAWRQETKGQETDPLPRLAAALAERVHLLCFDEFHVVNIADAMILGRLFEALFDAGVVVVATSNWPPERLYEGGLQRDRFLPFIELLQERTDAFDLGEGLDYRIARLRDMPTYHTPLGERSSAALNRAFERLTDGAQPHAGSVKVKGREIPVSRCARGVARFTFEELCAKPLGAGDYLSLARHFHSFILSDIPALGPDRRNEARRFMTLIDALYEHHCNLIVSAAALPESLYPEGDGTFEFQRTVSRLQEMQSKDYIAKPHLAARERQRPNTDGPAPIETKLNGAKPTAATE
ncbi:cell division protein ZapE [Limibacillus halophilus]|uniref:Cell division protein ZapE n=1 Tax=Limibacillus halophilus TaxID=1579333 RepID=A0A839SY44_9PROT|nr:cell division protein ZapE [Limibacillus halophilus]MBB3066456.1 cell division protein ZapE [Limibacillus halophilus]